MRSTHHWFHVCRLKSAQASLLAGGTSAEADPDRAPRPVQRHGASSAGMDFYLVSVEFSFPVSPCFSVPIPSIPSLSCLLPLCPFLVFFLSLSLSLLFDFPLSLSLSVSLTHMRMREEKPIGEHARKSRLLRPASRSSPRVPPQPLQARLHQSDLLEKLGRFPRLDP